MRIRSTAPRDPKAEAHRATVRPRIGAAFGVLVVALLAAAAVARPAAADVAPPGAEVANRICGQLYARLGFARFSGEYGTPELCAADVRHEAEQAVAACAPAGDRDACLEGQIRLVVDRYTAAGDLVGGLYTTATGERVRVMSSEGSGARDADRLTWANFLASLVHGRELKSVTLQLRSVREMRDACAPSALACYHPGSQTIVAVPDDQPLAPGAKSLVAHEYGHHVARNRLNAPWSALTYGTKRWATYMRVCERMRAQELRGHVLWGPAYRRSTAEGFAEAYRVLNEHRLGFSAPWVLVDELFLPDAEAMRLLAHDVTAPWTRPTRITMTGRGSRSLTVATPLDGTLRVKISARAGTRYRVSAPTIVCGQRNVVVRVRRLHGSGPFRLTISRP